MDGQKTTDTPTPQAPGQVVPGQTVSPQSSNLPPVSSAQPATTPTPQPVQDQSGMPALPSVDESSGLPQFATAQMDNPPMTDEPVELTSQFASDEVVRWTASEFIAHNKTSGWYGLLLLGTVVLSVLAWLVTRDIVSTAVVLLAGAILATYASRKPRQLAYQLDPSGLTIGQRHYSFNEFKSFSVVQEGAFTSVTFTPLKRFGTFTSIYYDPEDEDRIIDMVSQRLPHEERRLDVVDRLMRHIRF